ncbi:hypothetical protein ANN_05330 [Periplaneta americana]|uniref:Uncharacterized protein n=1 Tax=Periplaneta americana TaxID=6978 RepID=A0ABQ8TDC7_PERAM|nr:hypothetical protein ANN_05330 [Periplaneta americana]
MERPARIGDVQLNLVVTMDPRFVHIKIRKRRIPFKKVAKRLGNCHPKHFLISVPKGPFTMKIKHNFQYRLYSIDVNSYHSQLHSLPFYSSTSQVTSIEMHTFFESGHELLHNPSQHIDRYRSDLFSVNHIQRHYHVLGSCPFDETLRNSRHHKIRSVIAKCHKSNAYTTNEEVHGIADTGSLRRIDIITFKPGETKGYILDPTIKFDSHQNQPEEVNLEKRAIHEPTIPYYKTSYKLKDIEVIGLMVGARGP